MHKMDFHIKSQKLNYKKDQDSPVLSLCGNSFRKMQISESNQKFTNQEEQSVDQFSLSSLDFDYDQKQQNQEYETNTEMADDVQFKFQIKSNIFGQEQPLENQLQEHDDDDVNEQIQAQMPYLSVPSTKQLNLQQPLKITISSLYKHGKLRTDSEQVLPVVLTIESHNTQPTIKAKKKQVEGLDIIFIVDSRINKNELQMNDMKVALKILLNSVREEDRISVLIQTTQIVSFENQLNVNDLWKMIESIQEYQHAYNLDESVNESLIQIQNRDSAENTVKVIILFPLDAKTTPQIYQDIENNSDLCYFHFYQFGNYSLKNDLHCFNNLSNGCCTEIVYPQSIIKEVPSIFDGSKDNFIKNITIQLTGSQYENLQRTKFSQLYDTEMKQHNNFIGELAIDYLSYNQVYQATFDLLLPKCQENTQKQQIEFPVLEVSLTYTCQRSKFSDIKYFKINLLENNQIIPQNNILAKPAIIYYQQLVNRFLKQSYGKSNNFKIEIHNWIKNIIQRDNEIKQSLSPLLELMEIRAKQVVDQHP